MIDSQQLHTVVATVLDALAPLDQAERERVVRSAMAFYEIPPLKLAPEKPPTSHQYR